MKTCPRCRSPMVLRMARRGPNAGKPFWGCSRYPACKAIVDASSHSSGNDFELAEKGPNIFLKLTTDDFGAPDDLPSVVPRVFPIVVSARPREREFQSAFFQACGLLPSIVENLHLADVARSVVRAVAQWRLDFPLPPSDWSGMVQSERNIIAVAESILTRGTTPFCSPALELLLAVNIEEEAERIVEGMTCVALKPTCQFQPAVSMFDSQAEQVAFTLLNTMIRGYGLPWLCIPQIQLSSLSSIFDSRGGERGDFLLVHARREPVLVEIDGEHHKAHRARDRARDKALGKEGVRTIRIPTGEIREGSGPNLAMLEKILLKGRDQIPEETELSRAIRWCKYFHQIQLSLLNALKGGWLRLGYPWSIGVVLPAVLRGDAQATEIIRLAVKDFQELIFRLTRLYSRPFSMEEALVVIVDESEPEQKLDVLIGPADGSVDDWFDKTQALFLISDICLPVEIQAPLTSTSPERMESPDKEDARWFLRYLFRKDDFWPGQWETVKRVLQGLDSVVLLPTGGGKSIAFQLSALLLPGRCLVIDPILSLIEDQVDNLAAVGIDRCIGITSQLTRLERKRALDAVQSGHFLFCYVAPERLQTVAFRETLRALTTHTPVSLAVIDEAHCISEWGHDFRTAYLNLGRITRDNCVSQNAVPPLVALTGTASKIVLKDIQRELGIKEFDAIIAPTSFDRPELQFIVLSCYSKEKSQRLLGFLEGLPTSFGVERRNFFQPYGKRTYAGLVFCPHINGEYGIVEQAEYLQRHLKIAVGIYSGEAPRGMEAEEWQIKKRKMAHAFKRNYITLLVCTKAFGMGIDKPNIRYTVHIGLPSSIESFYQEAGRAGRDRQIAHCAIILSNDAPKRTQELLSPATSLEEIANIVNSTRWHNADDVVRALWFHVRAFRGEQTEVEEIATLLDQLEDIQQQRYVNITWRDERWSSKERAEKALHRLVILGIVEDYTIDFASDEFCVRIAGATQEDIAAAFGRYVSAYQTRLGEQAEKEALALRRKSHRGYVLAVAKQLVHFIYRHIEMARRRAFSEMFQAVATARTGEDLRRRILDYLVQSEWDERLEEVRASARGGMDLDSLAPILDNLVSSTDATALRAATGRLLASYPDVPGLLLLRAVSEALCEDSDPETVYQNINAALHFAFDKFNLKPEEVAIALGQVITRASGRAGVGELLMHVTLNAPSTNRLFVRSLIYHIPVELVGIPARWLLEKLKAPCMELATD